MNDSSATRVYFVETRASLYRQEADSVINEHNDAMLSFGMADLIVQGHDLYESVNRLDNDWRMLVFKGAAPYSEEFDKRIQRLYRSWYDTTEGTLKLFEKIRDDYIGRGFDKPPVDRLAAALREIKGAITDDGAFFNHESLTQLRDSAIDSFRAGDAEMV